MSALAGCPGTSTSVAVLLRRRGRGVASLGGHSREDAGTERGVFADGAVRVAAFPHPDARIARTATAALRGTCRRARLLGGVVLDGMTRPLDRLPFDAG